MTRDFQTHDEPRRARERHECPDPDCDADFGNRLNLITHCEESHGFEAFSNLTK